MRITSAVAALIVTCGVVTAASAQRPQQPPYPQQPYPQQPYPQQPYPQPPYAPYPPYPQQPYPQQPYPQQPYPQQPAPPPPSPSPSRPYGTDPIGLGYSITFAAAGTRVEVDQGAPLRTWAGGGFLHFSAAGLSDYISLRGRVTAFLGGGGGGYEGAGAIQFFAGLGVSPTQSSQLFVRLGSNAYFLKNDEIEASTTSFPAVELGYQFYVNGFGFSLSPQAGLAGRTEYEPGDEGQGRRYARRISTRMTAGGAASLFTDYVFFDASLLRVLDSDPLTIVEGEVCVVPYIFSVCGFAQYWRSSAIGPAPTFDVRTIPTTYFGLAVGVGIAGSRDAKLSATKPPF